MNRRGRIPGMHSGKPAKRALRKEPRRPSRPVTRVAAEEARREGTRPGVSRLLIAVLVVGTLPAVAPSVAAVVLLLDQRSQAGAAQPDAGLVLCRLAAAPNGKPAPPVKVAVKARHRGNLVLDVSASASLQGRPLFKGDVVAYTDMKQMPGVHAGAPVKLVESPTKKGLYRGATTVPMVGDWQVVVKVLGPGAKGEGQTLIPVGAVETRP